MFTFDSSNKPMKTFLLKKVSKNCAKKLFLKIHTKFKILYYYFTLSNTSRLKIVTEPQV